MYSSQLISTAKFLCSLSQHKNLTLIWILITIYPGKYIIYTGLLGLFHKNNDCKTNTTTFKQNCNCQNGGCCVHSGSIIFYFPCIGQIPIFLFWFEPVCTAFSTRTGPELTQIHWSSNNTDTHPAHHGNKRCILLPWPFCGFLRWNRCFSPVISSLKHLWRFIKISTAPWQTQSERDTRKLMIREFPPLWKMLRQLPPRPEPEPAEAPLASERHAQRHFRLSPPK